MNHAQTRYLLSLAAIFLFTLGFGFAWVIFAWTPPRTPNGELSLFRVAVPLVTAVSILLGSSVALYRFFNVYLFTIKQLAEGLTLIVTANPTHRVQAQGPAEVQQLARTINTFGEQYEALRATQQAEIQQAQADLETERNRLAALISEVVEGILVCTIEGQILLYNEQAKTMLSSAGGFVGLGRSVFGLVDRYAITHALDQLMYRLNNRTPTSMPRFVTTLADGKLLRVRLVPVFGQANTDGAVADVVTGFILTLEDITLQLKTSTEQDTLLRNLAQNVRASMGNIRVAIETMRQFPKMDATQLTQFRTIIHDEALKLSRKLNEMMTAHDNSLKAQWQFENMQARDVLMATQRHLEAKFELTVIFETEPPPDLWLRVDSYTIVQAISFIVYHIQTDLNIDSVNLYLQRTGRFANFDMVWQEVGVEREKIPDWRHQPLFIEGEGIPLTFDEVIERHSGEAWFHAIPGPTSKFRLLLPISDSQAPISRRLVPLSDNSDTNGSAKSRPEYYDFNLFEQTASSSNLDQRQLNQLTYTVFDTETTGLNPNQDEIISIGATRIVKGRLLHQEVFDQLVDPQRHVPATSVEIHGIAPEMLTGQPTIDHVLPKFYKFVDDTVLLGHNLAFDMRMLQVKEKSTNIQFTNPILDTLLLSAVVHPNQTDHSIEAIAQRLGINVMGRHTALGDAIVTGEIFLKFIPLLAEQGIKTLEQARQAAEQTYYARLQY